MAAAAAMLRFPTPTVAASLTQWRRTALLHLALHCRRQATTATGTTSTAKQPPLPDNLQRIVEDYDRQQKAREEDERRKQSKLLKTVMDSRYAGVMGMVFAGGIAFIVSSVDDAESDVHHITGLLLRRLEPGTAHKLWIRAASWGMTPRDYGKDDPYLVVEPLDGFRFATPVGLATGFDREARAPNAFFNLGFGFVDVGPVVASSACIETDADIAAIKERLASRDKTTQIVNLGIVGVALGGGCEQIRALVKEFRCHCNYLVLDLESVPKAEHGQEQLRKLVTAAVEASKSASSSIANSDPPLLLRVPENWPEASASMAAQQAAAADVYAAAVAGGAKGIIFASNSGTLNNERLATLKAKLAESYQATEGQLVLIAAGISSGRQAIECIEAGATVVQISSVLLTEGPGACRRIKTEIAELLMNEGYVNLHAAIGAAHRQRKRGRKKNLWRPKS